jgi:hypothetical protein
VSEQGQVVARALKWVTNVARALKWVTNVARALKWVTNVARAMMRVSNGPGGNRTHTPVSPGRGF